MQPVMRFLALIPAALLTASCARTGAETYTLAERLGRDWKNEVVTWSFAAPPKTCHPDSICMMGPDGTVPVQLLDVERWEETVFVRRATVAALVDLPARAHREYTLTYGNRPVAEPAATSNASTVTRTAQEIELGTGPLALRLRLGSGTTNAPGPIAGMRGTNGLWFGDSRLYGDTEVVRWEGALESDGPVMSRCRWLYDYADGTVMALQMELPAGGRAATWDMRVVTNREVDTAKLMRGPGFQFGKAPAAKTAPTFGWLLDVDAGLDELRVLACQEHYENRWGGDTNKRPLFNPAAEPPGLLINLAPWDGWWDQEVQGAIHLYRPEAEPLLSVVSIDPGRWIEPLPPGSWASYGTPRMRHQWVPLERDEEGGTHLRFRASVGQRRWVLAPAPPVAKAGDGVPGSTGRELARVMNMVLDWEGDEGSHPRLFISPQDIAERRARDVDPALIKELVERGKGSKATRPGWRDAPGLTAWLLTGDRQIAEELFLVKRLRTWLERFGGFDTMRGASVVACYYDALIDGPLITPEDKELFRAQFAYLAYHIASPSNWSMERGYASGNLNMSVAHILNLGVLAATIPDHPMAREWSQSALAMMEKWLDRSVGPDGEFLGSGESLANYAFVSVSMMMVYAIAADRAGFAEFAEDPRLQRLMLHLAKIFTPPDPRFGDKIGSPPVGRGPSHSSAGLSGLMARFTASVDPAYSATQQWHWLRTGQSTDYVGDRMGGLENLYMDPTLPARNPGWGSETISKYGAILRHGTGTESPWWAFFLIEGWDRLVYDSECGSVAAMYAHGVPVSERFGLDGYEQRENLFISRVLPAYEVGDEKQRRRRWSAEGKMGLTDSAFLSRQDYVVASLDMERWKDPCKTFWEEIPAWPPAPGTAKLPVHWKRQLLFVRDDKPEGVNYFVFRDTVSGGQPTVWQMWTSSETLGTPEQAADREAFLAEAPGKALVDARRLEGDRFTALGRLGVDVDFYIATPTNTPRYTLRHGDNYYHYYDQYHDLLRLERVDDGAYFVAMCPRPADRAAPQFATEGNGHVIRVRGDWGEDFVFLANDPVAAECGEVIRFEGTAGSVQQRGGGAVLCLGAAGEVAIDGGWGLRADGPCVLRDGHIELPEGGKRTTVHIRAPGAEWEEHRE